MVACRSVSDVVGAITYATATGDRIAPRGGGHCFAGRSSTDGIVLDMSGLDGIRVAADRLATIGADHHPHRGALSGHRAGELVTAWQAWAPDAPDELTVNLSLVSEPGAAVQAILFGAGTLEEGSTRKLLQEFTDQAGADPTIELRTGVAFYHLKSTFTDLDLRGRALRIRSEFFSHAMSDRTLASLLTQLGDPRTRGRRQLVFTAMGGAYNRVAADATAFAHRSERFLLEHIAEAADPWVDRSWATAHADGSGRVYPNFPDPALDDWAAAYHAGNYPRLAAVKNAYDPHRFFDFPQAV